MFRLQGSDFAPTLGETLPQPGITPALADEAKTAFVTGLHVAVVASLMHIALGVIALRWMSVSRLRGLDVGQAAGSRRS